MLGAFRSSRLGALSRKVAVAATTLVLVLILAPAVFAQDGHDHGGGFLGNNPILWALFSLGGVFVLLVGARMILLRGIAATAAASGRGKSDTSYIGALQQFSPNAKFFLGYSLMAELGGGIWSVMFNLYLLSLGFPILFIGQFWFVNMICHGFGALPAGIIGDRFGRRRAFFAATTISLIAQGSLLFTLDPSAILVLAGIAGFGEAFHGVTGTPFMMENTTPRERPHLFSLNAAFTQFSRFAGSMSGGLLPLLLAMTLGVPSADPAAVRWALVLGLPLTLFALTPLIFIKEKSEPLTGNWWKAVLMAVVTPALVVVALPGLAANRDPDSKARRLLALGLPNVVNYGLILKITALSLMSGMAFGLTVRFFNVFFQTAHGATGPEIGTILALGSVAGAGAVLVSPLLVQRWGKAKSILITQSLAVPFLLAIAFAPTLPLVSVLYLFRNSFSGISRPLTSQLSMEFINPRERGTTAGFTHTVFDLAGGIGAGAAGMLVVDSSGFGLMFVVAAITIIVPAYLYYALFDRMENQKRAEAEAAPALQPAGAMGA
ncbi:MAG: hypothetical protein HW416_694 [Chloroflexi bacterium]|nr:hypothetical protein [Chloroflexota bacterium]